MKQILIYILALSNVIVAYGQSDKSTPKISEEKRVKIAVTIDDVPNTRKFEADNYNPYLLQTLDSLNIPIAIFINEGLIYKTKDTSANLELLENWVKKKYITLGNHTFSHSRCSEVGFDDFKKDIESGERITRKLANKFDKPLEYFRFPYNDLGIDSIQQARTDSLLYSMGYEIAPFTIESSDWIFNAVYEYFLSNGSQPEAEKLGELYVRKTLAYVHFFDSLSNAEFGRSMNQILLCHDNSINAKYLKYIIEELKLENAEFVSIENAMSDEVYKLTNNYHKKWGISWFYRWMSDSNLRKERMKQEPDLSDVEHIYDTIVK